MEWLKLLTGSVHEFEKRSKDFRFAISISEGFARNIISAVINIDNIIKGLSETLKKIVQLNCKFEDKKRKKEIFYYVKYVLALAIQRLFLIQNLE